jgi:hypothetical protein
VIKYIQREREVERAFSFSFSFSSVAYVLVARSLWWITCICTCLVGRAHGAGQMLGPSCWNQALVIVMEDKTWEAEAFEPLINCPFWPPVLHLRSSMIKFLCSNSLKWNIIIIIYYIRWWPATWATTNSSNWARWLERINDFVSIIITQINVNLSLKHWCINSEDQIYWGNHGWWEGKGKKWLFSDSEFGSSHCHVCLG